MARFNRRFGRIFILAWISLAFTFACAASADVLWSLGWGYSWEDATGGAAMVLGGVLFWFFWHGILGFIELLNYVFYGPDNSNGSD